jgi:hypothetical protein
MRRIPREQQGKADTPGGRLVSIHKQRPEKKENLLV